ncbi:MAG: hypothetical protein GX889_01945 [Clostridiales bacterium]|nr:hypothetical protein [Clostridiales bacterium]
MKEIIVSVILFICGFISVKGTFNSVMRGGSTVSRNVGSSSRRMRDNDY